MEQFNPSLRNFIAMGKNYEKALAGEPRAGERPVSTWTAKPRDLAPLSRLSRALGLVLRQRQSTGSGF